MRILYVPTFNKITHIDRYFFGTTATSEQNPDIILVSGGDGSLLHAIQDYHYMNVPFFGIAAGTKNFLMNDISVQDLENFNFEQIDIVHPYTIEVTVNRKRSNGTNNIIFKSIAVNDIVIGGGIMDYNAFYIGESIGIVKGMGLICSTAIGSTAFFYNNGGKIIEDIESKEIGFATIVSEKEKSFNIHKELKDPIRIVIKSERSKPILFVDGETKAFELKKEDEVYISYGKKISLGFINKGLFMGKRRNLI